MNLPGGWEFGDHEGACSTRKVLTIPNKMTSESVLNLLCYTRFVVSIKKHNIYR